MATERNPIEVLSDQLAAWIVERAKAMPQAKVPFGQRKLSGAEQWARYQQMRDNPQVWTDIVAKQGVEGAVQYFKAMSRLGERHGQEADYGQTTDQGE